MINEKDIPEFIGQLIDRLEDYLANIKDVTPSMLPNRDPNYDIAIIHGENYDLLANRIREVFNTYKLQSKDFKFTPLNFFFIIEHIYTVYFKVIIDKIEDIRFTKDDAFSIKCGIIETFDLWGMFDDNKIS